MSEDCLLIDELDVSCSNITEEGKDDTEVSDTSGDNGSTTSTGGRHLTTGVSFRRFSSFALLSLLSLDGDLGTSLAFLIFRAAVEGLFTSGELGLRSMFSSDALARTRFGSWLTNLGKLVLLPLEDLLLRGRPDLSKESSYTFGASKVHEASFGDTRFNTTSGSFLLSGTIGGTSRGAVVGLRRFDDSPCG